MYPQAESSTELGKFDPDRAIPSHIAIRKNYNVNHKRETLTKVLSAGAVNIKILTAGETAYV
jgi:hypothetical protein